MATAQDIINRAYRLSGIKPDEQTIEASENKDALEILNDILDEWSTSQLLPYVTQEDSITLTSSDPQYTIGTGGDISTDRPIRVTSAYVRDVTNNTNYPMKIVNKVEWDSIYLKTDTIDYPNTLYYEPSFPLGVINIYPTPSKANTLYITSQKQFSSLADYTSELNLPVGYKKALLYCLASELDIEWAGKEANPILAQKADELKSKLEIINNQYKKEPITFDIGIRNYNRYLEYPYYE